MKTFNFLQDNMCGVCCQILNRTNNIFELVTVEPVLGEGPGDRHRGLEPVIQEEESAADEKSLRLKGNAHGQLKLQIIIYKHVLF